MKLLFFFILVLFSINCSAQIKGTIIDSKTKEPLAFASVQFQNTRKGTFTNKEGIFIFPSIRITDTLLIRYIGYKDKYIKISKDTTMLIKLESAPFELSKVDVVHYDEKYLARIIHDCVVKKTFSGKTIDCKSFAKINTYQNDTLLRESFEAFYNTEINEFQITKNNFKNGILLTSKYDNTKMFRTLDLFSVVIPYLKIYSKPRQNSTNYSKFYYAQKIKAKHKLESPINSYFASKIIDDFTLKGLALEKNTLKISYYSKQDTSVFGYLIIDIDKNDLLEYSNNALYTKALPIESDNSNYHIHNLELKTHMIFNDNRPQLLNIIMLFDYKNIRTQKIEKIKMSAKQLLYDFGNNFSELQPEFINNYDDYTLLSITPIISELWQNELVFLKTLKESAKTANMLDFNYNTSSLSVWNKNWQLDWNKATVIDPNENQFPKKKYKLVKLSTFILLDYYKSADTYIIKTSTVFNYKNLKIYQKQKTEFMKILFEKYFNEVHLITDNLSLKLNTTPNITEKEILKAYRKADKAEKKIKRAFKKEQRRYLIRLMNKDN